MKAWCLKDHNTSKIFKVIFTEEKLQEYLNANPNISECIDCVECDDAPSICIE